jgi:DNA-binding transcriptional MerR regulator
MKAAGEPLRDKRAERWVDGRTMKMQELERRTGVNRETIRILIRKGLLPEPDKPKPTVAHYTEDHVHGVLAIRQLQQQYRMTLAQIGDVLKGRPVDQRIESMAFAHLEQLVKAGTGYTDQLIPVASLTDANQHASTDAKAFESLGMVDRLTTADGEMVNHTDAQLISIWGKMRALGFDEDANFPPETLDHYAKAAAYLARAEAERFVARTKWRMDETRAAQMLQTALPLMLDFFGLLRMKLFLRNLHELEAADQESESIKAPLDPTAGATGPE